MSLKDLKAILHRCTAEYRELQATYKGLKPGPERDRVRGLMLTCAQSLSGARAEVNSIGQIIDDLNPANK